MRADFEITLPAIDRLAALAAEAIGGDGVARMTGGGFGGCVVALAPEAKVEAVRARIARDYRSPGGEPAGFTVCRPSAGADPVGEG